MGHLGPLGNYVLGVGQWHPAMTYRDSLFGVRTYSCYRTLIITSYIISPLSFCFYVAWNGCIYLWVAVATCSSSLSSFISSFISLSFLISFSPPIPHPLFFSSFSPLFFSSHSSSSSLIQSASQYSVDFKEFSGADAEYVGAGAAATAYVLGVAIQQQYATRPHTPGTSIIKHLLKEYCLCVLSVHFIKCTVPFITALNCNVLYCTVLYST